MRIPARAGSSTSRSASGETSPRAAARSQMMRAVAILGPTTTSRNASANSASVVMAVMMLPNSAVWRGVASPPSPQ